MKLHLAKLGTIAAAIFCAQSASAQTSSVQLYGLIDTAVEHLSNTGATGKGLTRMPGLTASLPSRWGLRGTEDLGGGLKTTFVLESGFSPDTGVLNQGARLFGRQAFVGVSGAYGTLTAGRHHTMLFWSLFDSDVIGPHAQSMANFDSYIPNARADNSVSYLGKFSGITLGATYSLGRDAVNAGPSPAGTNCAGENAADGSACREWSAMVKYDAPNWGMAFAIDELRGGAGAYGGLNLSSMKDRRTVLNGYAKLSGSKIGAGLIRRDNDAVVATPRSDLWYLGASHPLTPQVTLYAQWVHYDLKDSANDGDLMIVRGTYAFSKRTAVYASVARANNKGAAAFAVSTAQVGGNPLAGTDQTGVALGIRHSF